MGQQQSRICVRCIADISINHSLAFKVSWWAEDDEPARERFGWKKDALLPSVIGMPGAVSLLDFAIERGRPITCPQGWTYRPADVVTWLGDPICPDHLVQQYKAEMRGGW